MLRKKQIVRQCARTVSGETQPPFFCVLRAPWKTVKTIALLLMAATSIFASTNAPQRLGVRVTSSEQSGAEITQVIPGSAAEAAGLRAGYVINSVDTKPVRTAQDFEIALANRVPGSMIRVTYIFRSKLGWLSNEVDVTFPAASENIGQQFSRKMSNTDVIDMASLGLSDDVIVDKIRLAQATDFDTSVSALKVLKIAKVSDAVIRAMINSHPTAIDSTVSEEEPSGVPADIGVYVLLKGKVTEVDPEVVGWQTGGVMKALAKGGLDKGHINGKIMRPRSTLQLTNPVEFIIKVPEGTGISEYQLLRLDKKGDRREFRAITGGILHASAGAERNSLQFKSEKIASRTWQIVIRDLKAGEYAFLPPGLSSVSISSSGKAYPFGVIE
jgi:hypothetical protein